jgi:hypothetical protein
MSKRKQGRGPPNEDAIRRTEVNGRIDYKRGILYECKGDRDEVIQAVGQAVKEGQSSGHTGADKTERRQSMKLPEIKEKASTMGIKVGKMKKGEIIRAIQAKEGNSPCFDTGKAAECGQSNCLWREDCH